MTKKYKRIVKRDWGMFSGFSIPLFLIIFITMISTAKFNDIQELKVFGYSGLAVILILLLIIEICAEKSFEEKK